MDTEEKEQDFFKEIEIIAKKIEEISSQFAIKMQELLTQKQNLITEFRGEVDQHTIKKIKKELSQ
jgi:ABC-type phosphonate transport system ATPase subunit